MPEFQLNAPDRRSLRLHQAIAAKLRSNPQLLDPVRARIDVWVQQGRGRRDLRYRLEWQKAVNAGLDAVLLIALDEGERGQVMRTCAPLAGVLSEDERQMVVQQAWREWPGG